MSKKMVLQVDAVGDACRAKAMNSVAQLCGVKSIAMDGEKMTVIGDVDVVWVAKKLKKANFKPVVLGVGPEKEEKKPDDGAKKPADEPKKPPCCAGCTCCRPPPPPPPVCCPPPPPPPVAPWPGKVVYCDEPQPGCVIL